MSMQFWVLGIAMAEISKTCAGASHGKWRMLWSPEEVDDSVHVLDWIVRQSWSSGQVSYPI